MRESGGSSPATGEGLQRETVGDLGVRVSEEEAWVLRRFAGLKISIRVLEEAIDLSKNLEFGGEWRWARFYSERVMGYLAGVRELLKYPC